MRSVLESAGMLNPPRRSKPTRPRKANGRGVSGIESLERREVMSGAGVPFASFPDVVTTPGDVAHVVIHFDAGELASTRAPAILLGVYARPTAGSSLVPNITGVENASGRLARAGLPQRGSATEAKAVYLTSVPLGTGQAQDLTVDVAGLNGKTGGFTLETFLPGDANGDGQVNATDLSIIQGAYGSASGQSNFNPNADFNADGHVGCVDRLLAEMNQGAHAAYSPFVAPAVSTTPVVAPAVVTPTATVPVVDTTPAPTAPPVAAPAPIVTPPVVATTPAVTTTPVVVAPAQPVVATPTVQATPVVVAPLQTAPVTTVAYAPATAPAPLYVMVPVSQAPTGYTPSGVASPTYYYGQPVAASPGTVSLTSPSTMPGVAYYVGQPVVQAPGYGQVISNQATTPNVVYLGQPVVQASGTNAAAAQPVVYYYGQPAGQAIRA